MTSVVCFIPCCSRKVASGKIAEYQNRVLEREKFGYPVRLREARSRLEELASSEKYDITFYESPLTSALYLYKGAFYKQLSLKNIIREIKAGKLKLFILSAGYGVVNAFEPIGDYDGKLQGRIASFWREYDLVGVISDILLSLRPSHVYGFFAGSETWSRAGAKYRYFFIEGLKGALDRGLRADLSGCFFRASGRGATQILGALGRTFQDFMESGFKKSFVRDLENNFRIDGSVRISYRNQSP